MGKGRWMKENGMQCNWAFRWEKNQTYAWTYRRPQSACRCRGLIADEALPEESSSKPPWINISGILSRTGKRRLPLSIALQWAREREGEIEERRMEGGKRWWWTGDGDIVEVETGDPWRRRWHPWWLRFWRVMVPADPDHAVFTGRARHRRGKKRRCLCPISWPGARQY